MRKVWLTIVAAVIFGVVSTPPEAAAQAGFDRPGGDYKRQQLMSGDPAECALSCERDRGCRAWSFSYPAGRPGGALCYLKTSVPKRTADPCCVSGVRGAGVVENRTRTLEMSIDRIGGDLRDFALKADQGDDACRRACDADNKCRAWTFARAGYGGREARCFLKSQIKPPRRSPCCISGVVR
jgi:hypothetical protein